MATGPHIRLIQGRKRPSLVGLAWSTIWPIATSVKASTKRATIISRPTIAEGTPMMSV